MKTLPFIALVFTLLIFNRTNNTSSERCEVQTKYEFYDITGNTVEELKSAMLKNGPVDEAGKHRFAYTSWSVRWSWPTIADGKKDFNSITVSCSATVKLPRWNISEGSPIDLIRRWNEFMERVKSHEDNHVLHVSIKAPLVKTRIEEAYQQKGGGMTSVLANRIAFKVLNEIRTLDRQYDELTHNGKTEGAWEI